jgi:hypothetical protein
MNVILGKPGPSLAPPSGQGYPYSVKDGCLPTIVGTDKDGRIAKLHIDVLDGTKAIYVKPGDTHEP